MVVEWWLNDSRMMMIYRRCRRYYTVQVSVVGSWNMVYSPLHRHSFRRWCVVAGATVLVGVNTLAKLNYSVENIRNDIRQKIIGARVSEPHTNVFNCDFS